MHFICRLHSNPLNCMTNFHTRDGMGWNFVLQITISENIRICADISQ